jgi:hypothetical protein
MYKIKLPNGVEVETDSPDEASKLIHKVYWKDFQREYSTDEGLGATDKAFATRISKKRKCLDCENKVHGKAHYCQTCKYKRMRASQIKWAKNHKKQIGFNPIEMPSEQIFQESQIQ